MEQNWQSAFKQPQEESVGAVSQKAVEKKKFSKNDFISSIIVGLIIGIFAPFILQNIGKILPYQDYYFAIFPVLTLVGIWISYLIGSRLPVIIQIAKFGVVGVVNTLVDWGVLAALMVAGKNILGVNSETIIFIIPIISASLVYYTVYKSISFVVASINSYFWNKYWTFKKSGLEKAPAEFVQFFIVSFIGFLINVATATIILRYITPFANFNLDQWGIISAAFATIISLFWNFIGYKFMVFKD